jgi:diguanylate cyclase (GGDEF)-like protein/PAS domain S-box-containing protein/putative nucleotidyltransferase with HDIG domain
MNTFANAEWELNIAIPSTIRERLVLWQEMVDATGDGILYFGTEGFCHFASAHTSNLLGWMGFPLVGVHWTEIFPGIPPHITTKTLDIPRHSENKRENRRWIRATVLGSEWESDTGTVLHLKDISQEKTSELLLRRSEACFEASVSHLRTGFVLGNAQRRIARINDELCRQFSLPCPAKEYIGEDCHTVAHHASHLFEDAIGFCHQVAEIIRQKRPLYDQHLITKDGQHFDYDYIPIFQNDEYLGHLWLFREMTEIRNSEQALRDSERRYRALVDAHAEGVWRAAPDGTILERSPNLLANFPVPEGGDWYSLLHPDYKVVPGQKQWTKATGKSGGLEANLRVCNKDGEYRWRHFRAIPILDDAGAIKEFVGTVSDVTEKLETERRLRESEERFRAIAEASPLGIYVEDIAANCIYVNPAYERLVGFSFADIQGNRWKNIVHPEDMQRLQGLWVMHLQDLQEKPGFLLEYKYRVIRSDSTIRWCHGRTTAMRDDEGVLIGFVGVLEDITERLEAERNLWQSREQFRAMSDASPLGIFVEDAAGNCIYTNPEYSHIVGYSSEEMLGIGWRRRFHRDDLRTMRDLWGVYRTKLQNESNEIFCFTHRTILPNGTMRWCQERIAPSWGADGELTGYVGTLEDVTERFAAEQALRDSEERYRALVDASFDFVFRVDATTERIVLRKSPDEEQEQTLEFAIIESIHPEDQYRLIQQLIQAKEEGAVFEAEFRVRGENRTWREVVARAVPVRNPLGNIREWVGTLSDVTLRKEAERERNQFIQEAIHQAERDSLTGVYNHRTFYQKLLIAEQECQQEGKAFAVAVLDVDNFKYFNDVYGHLTGDDVLTTVVRVIQEECNPSDILGRLGGDEFAILIRRDTTEAIDEVLYRLRVRVQNESYLPPQGMTPVPLRLSLGSALYPQEAQTAVEAIALADRRALLDKGGEQLYPARDITEYLRLNNEGFAMLDGLVTAVDNKDRYTRRHSEEVLIYSLQMAKQLQLSEEDLEMLKLGALVHDVGKIGVPDQILRMPGRLGSADYEIMQRHVELGALLVGAIPEMRGVLEMVLYHHEKWDGTGYPAGLKGEAIPYLARLLAVADAFSAMTTDRPYRKGRSHAEALHELRKGAGTQWDPVFVQVLERYFSEEIPTLSG